MATREAFILESSVDKTQHVCIDAIGENQILDFLKKDETRLKKFRLIVRLILEKIRNTELYDKEDFDKRSEKVTAMKLFKGGQNIRIYCKEQKGPPGSLIVIVAELLEKKKSNKLIKLEKSIIHRVASHEYTIVKRPGKSLESGAPGGK